MTSENKIYVFYHKKHESIGGFVRTKYMRNMVNTTRKKNFYCREYKENEFDTKYIAEFDIVKLGNITTCMTHDEEAQFRFFVYEYLVKVYSDLEKISRNLLLYKNCDKNEINIMGMVLEKLSSDVFKVSEEADYDYELENITDTIDLGCLLDAFYTAMIDDPLLVEALPFI